MDKNEGATSEPDPSVRSSLFMPSQLLRPVVGLGLLIQATLSPVAARQEPPADPVSAVIDLSVEAVPGRPLLVDLSSRVRGSLTVVTPDARVRSAVDERRDIAFVDEFTAAEGERWSGTRQFLRFDQTVGRVVVDPELVGVRVAYSASGESFDASLIGRGVRGQLMDGLLAEAPTLGLRLDLPDDARVGEPIELAPGALGALLTDALGDVTAIAELELRAVDESGVARVTGRLITSEVRREEAAVLAVRYEGECKLTVDTHEHRLLELIWSGQRTVVGTGSGFEVEGAARFDLELTTGIGAAVTRALLLEPRYRQVPRDLTQRGVTLELPSHWFLSSDEDHTRFTTTLYGGGQPVTLELGTYPIGSSDRSTYVDETIERVQEQKDVDRVRPVRCSLGRGKACEFEADGHTFWFEVLPHDERHVLRIRLFGEPGAVRAALGDWRAARRSLRLLAD